MRVFLDTNVLIAAFATRGLCADVMRLVLAEHELVVGETVLEEMARVLAGKLSMPPRPLESIMAFVRRHATVIQPDQPAPWPERHPDDRWVVAAAVQGRVDVLVTGDRDLLELETELPFRVVSPRGFWEALR